MKKVLFLLISIVLVFTAYGCNINEENPFSINENLEEKPINYKIDKIILSKGFQSIEPGVEIIKKNSNLKLLASIGLIESSGVKIDNITKSGNEVNIYIDRILDKDSIQLAVPQIIIEIDDPIIKKFEELNFNIINKNYDTIPLKFSKSQILNKIYSQFKIAPNTIPDVQLTKEKDNIFWNIYFQNIFDKENPKSPLVNFTVEADARTGEILNSKKDAISNYIDDGYLLDYLPNSYLLYKRQHVEKDNEYESLWTYNIKTRERNKVYTSKDKIHSALFSPDNKYISLIELGGTKADLYIIPMSDKVAYKITPVNHLQPRLIKWKDNTNLYIVNIDENKSTLLTYNVKENSPKVKFDLNLTVEAFDISDDNFIFIENHEDSINKNIYLTKNGLDFKKIDTGFKATFFNNNNIIYLKNIEKEDKNTLHIYDIKTKNERNNLERDITNYFKLNKEDIIFIEKNTCNNDYTLARYNIIENSIIPIAKIINDKIFYDPAQEIGYINLIPPFDDNKDNVIYCINLKKLNIIND